PGRAMPVRHRDLPPVDAAKRGDCARPSRALLPSRGGRPDRSAERHLRRVPGFRGTRPRRGRARGGYRRGNAERETQMGKLDSKIAIVTGAASGLGKAIALLFAREGAEIAIIDLKAEEAEAVAREARDLGRRSLAVVADVAEEASVSQAMD